MMYSEARDKQAQAAKAAWDKVDLKSQIEVPRKNRVAILAEQLATEDGLSKVKRDALIRGVVTAAPGTTNSKPEDGTVAGQLANIEALVKPGSVTGLELDAFNPKGSRATRAKKLEAWRKARRDEALAQRNYDDLQAEFARFGLSEPACDGILAGDAKTRAKVAAWIAKHPKPGPAVQGAMVLANSACSNLNIAHAAVEAAQPKGGQLGAVYAQLADEKQALEDLKSKKAAEREEVTDALEDGADAVEKGDRARVMAAAAKLKKNFDILIEAQDPFSIEFVSAKKQESIDKFLAAVADTSTDKAPPADTSRAALALILFPKFFDNAEKEMADADTVSLAPLVLQKALAKIDQDVAARDIATRYARIALLQQKLDVLTRQADAYYDVDAVATSMTDASLKTPIKVMLASDADKPVAGSSPTLDERVRIWKLFAKYIDTGTRLEAESRKIDYRLLALANEQQLTLAESNVAQWNTLISANIDQMAAFGASGIKAEQIVSLINSLSLLWIGSGVNK
ncbi:MAG: hypothetical protein ACM31P_03405 [Actinomycetota bacterium]